MAEKDTSTLLIYNIDWCSSRMAEWSEIALFSLEEVGMQVQIVFLPFGFLLFILTADPVSFARFLRKRFSSFMH